jgi:hypothetical protein
VSLHKEISFETEICAHLAAHGWLYAEGDAASYDRARALLPFDVLAWGQVNQPKAWEPLLNDACWDVSPRKVRGLRAGVPPADDIWHKPVLPSDRSVTTDSRGGFLETTHGWDAAGGRPGTEVGAWRVVRRHQRWRQGVVALCASLVLAGCSASRTGARGQYAQSRDSATQASLSRPSLAVPQVGVKLPVVPQLGPVLPPVGVKLLTAGAQGGQVVIDASKSLDSELLKRIHEALAECANMARAEMLLKRFQGRSPTAEKCNEVVGKDKQGKPMTWAMQLGVEGRSDGIANQRELYKNALKAEPRRVQPHLGVY